MSPGTECLPVEKEGMLKKAHTGRGMRQLLCVCLYYNYSHTIIITVLSKNMAFVVGLHN